LLLDELDFIARLAAIIPHPRVHLTTYHGVLGPAAALRARVVPAQDPNDGPHTACPAPHEHRIVWRTLLLRVFGVDPLRCPRCGGELVLRALIRDALRAQAVLSFIERARPPPLQTAVRSHSSAPRPPPPHPDRSGAPRQPPSQGASAL
jgi:hypothetical protein